MEQLSEAEVDRLRAQARKVRQDIVEMFTISGGGHFGGSLSLVEILVTLYGAVVRFDPARPDWPDRDRLVLSKGHACGALCSVLADSKFFDEALLATFNELDSPLGMHPDMHKIPGCDMSTGALGHGLAVGIGMAIAGRADGRDYRVYVVLGDGECNEGSVWEAAQAAAHYKLGNLIAIVDRNWVSLDGNTEEIMALEPFGERWRSFRWNVITVDGHDFRQLHAAIRQTQAMSTGPSVVIANTVKGKGISFMERKHEYHYASLSGDQLATARLEVGGETR